MNILFLYAEVMPYTVSVLGSLIEANPSLNIHVISWGKDKKLTPYEPPRGIERVFFLCEKDMSVGDIVQYFVTHNVKLIVVSGRQTAKYLSVLKVIRASNHRVPVISGMDNQFEFTTKIILKVLLAKWLYKRYFDYLWVPGPRQYMLARLMQYKKEKIVFDLLSSS